MLYPSNSAQVRVSNIRTLLTAIRDHGPVAKRELQQITGLSWGSVSSLTNILLHKGYVVAEERQVASTGRKPDDLDININDNFIIGIDLNITGLCGIVTDLKGRIVQERMRLFPRLDRECILHTLYMLLDDIMEMYAGKHIVGIGMAVQGVVNTEDGISVLIPSVSDWERVPLRQLLSERYRCPVSLWHDPNCLMIAERKLGTPLMRNAEDALLIRLDQGIGMSILSNGELHFGVDGEAGELGHVVNDPDGPLCRLCGKKGCLSVYASGAGLTEQFIEAVNHNRQTQIAFEKVQTLTYRDIAEAAHKGDKLSLELFHTMGEKLGMTLSVLYTLFNPEVIVMYGDMCQQRELFLAPMHERLQRHLYRNITVQLVFSELGRNAAALGAALMVSDDTIGSLEFEEWDNTTE